MPVQSNITGQNVITYAWDGAAAAGNGFAQPINKFTRYAFSFEIVAVPAADIVIEFDSAPPSAADPCIPGAFTPVEAVPMCENPALAGNAQMTIPAGTPIGTVCGVALPCRPDVFVRPRIVAGGTDIRGFMLRQGPKI